MQTNPSLSFLDKTHFSIGDWKNWKWQLKNQITKWEELESWLVLTQEEKEAFHEAKEIFEFSITPYYASLMDKINPSCPIRLQAIPRKGELYHKSNEVIDPLAEESHMPVLGITHRYPDRVLWYLSHVCAVYCRFCTRKRKVSQPFQTPHPIHRQQALEYIKKNPTIREVILSGGDPLSLSDHLICSILKEIREIPHIVSIRIHTRYPVTLPMRITPELCKSLSLFYPLTVVTHFNHPKECTEEARDAIRLLRTVAHAVVLNQSVLLKGVNDSPEILKELSYQLVKMGVIPYYLHQCDEIKGISHFQVPVENGLKIMEQMQGWISGIAVPKYVVDLKGGGGKIPLYPNYLILDKEFSMVCRNYKGEIYEVSNGN